MVRPIPATGASGRGTKTSVETVSARRLLLDAADALEPVLAAVVLGGGQAIDVRVPRETLPIPLSTQDSDLTIDVEALTGPAPFEDLLLAADLVPAGRHGHWQRRENRLLQHLTRRRPVRVDVMVPDETWPESTAGLDPRKGGAASLMPPMVLTVLDDSPTSVGALDSSDLRRRTLRVAGAASLLLTKVHKFQTKLLRAIARRRPLSTMSIKDILDVLRLLLAPGDDIESGLDRIRSSPRGRSVLCESLTFLDQHFARPQGLGWLFARETLAPHGGDELALRASRRAAALCDRGRDEVARMRGAWARPAAIERA